MQEWHASHDPELNQLAGKYFFFFSFLNAGTKWSYDDSVFSYCNALICI